MATIDALRDLIWTRDAGLCGICGLAVERPKMDMDHIIPRSRGGPDSFDNLRVAHSRCNRKRGAGREVVQEYDKYLVRLPSRVHQQIKRLARLRGVSMNTLMITVLRESATQAEAGKDPAQ